MKMFTEQIKVYKKLLEVAKRVRDSETVKGFDRQKVVGDDGNVKAGFGNGLANEIVDKDVDIKQYNYNLSLKYENAVYLDSGCWHRVRGDDLFLDLGVIDRRFSYVMFRNNCNSRIDDLEKEITKIGEDMKDLDSMETEYNEILQTMYDYQNKHSREVQVMKGWDFQLD